MFRIALFCSAGMSTSAMVDRMREVAKKQNLDVDIHAYADSRVEDFTNNIDVVLLGPQITYKKRTIEKHFAAYNVPVAVIPIREYGMMNGEAVLKLAYQIIERGE